MTEIVPNAQTVPHATFPAQLGQPHYLGGASVVRKAEPVPNNLMAVYATFPAHGRSTWNATGRIQGKEYIRLFASRTNPLIGS